MRSRTALFIFFSFLASPCARGESYVHNAIVQGDDSCQSGVKLGVIMNDEDGNVMTQWRCALPFKKADLRAFIGQTIKVRFEYGRGVYKLIEIDPVQSVGSKKGGLGDILGDVLDPAGPVADAAAATTTQQPPQPTPSEPGLGADRGPGSQEETQTVHPKGVNQCISSFWDNSGGITLFTFRNSCNLKVNLRFVNKNGGGGSMDLAPGDKQQTGDTPDAIRKYGGYEYYACPYHYIAVDTNGKLFGRPIASYRCDPAGY